MGFRGGRGLMGFRGGRGLMGFRGRAWPNYIYGEGVA